MSTVLKRQPASIISCPGARPRKYCMVLKVASAIPSNTSSKAVSTVDAALRKRTGSFVNFSATAVDFYRVMARLEAASSLPPETLSGMSPAVPILPAPQRKAWSGILEGMFGRSTSRNQEHIETPDTTSDFDNDSPLTHAVVMFTATWCGPCSVVYRELKLAAGRLQDRPPTAIIVVDVDEEKELASQLGIKALPTLLYLSPDESRGPIFSQGPVSASFILDALDRAAVFGGRDVMAKWRKL
ncbi:hypothetical protein VaNZ11_004049 [Volvox africanus]|uniref:Thioredoxin domain-containing protein n=1 Tax=Volvox africanus TaxID=51714 RepID=A0ABQ5RVH5_9CHLO|nr:hypothetical protein VaNZ11_004049 [Volvox africanus]